MGFQKACGLMPVTSLISPFNAFTCNARNNTFVTCDARAICGDLLSEIGSIAGEVQGVGSNSL